MNTILEIKDLNLWYGDHQALHNISVDLPRNEITALIGPSGCGKSTLIDLILQDRFFGQLHGDMLHQVIGHLAAHRIKDEVHALTSGHFCRRDEIAIA